MTVSLLHAVASLGIRECFPSARKKPPRHELLFKMKWSLQSFFHEGIEVEVRVGRAGGQPTSLTRRRRLPLLCRASYSLWGHSRHFIIEIRNQATLWADFISPTVLPGFYLYALCIGLDLWARPINLWVVGRHIHCLTLSRSWRCPIFSNKEDLWKQHFLYRTASYWWVSFNTKGGHKMPPFRDTCSMSQVPNSFLETVVMSFGGFRLLSQSRDAV